MSATRSFTVLGCLIAACLIAACGDDDSNPASTASTGGGTGQAGAGGAGPTGGAAGTSGTAGTGDGGSAGVAGVAGTGGAAPPACVAVPDSAGSAATVTPDGAAVVAETVTGTAQNQMELDTGNRLSNSHLGPLRRGPCGKVAVAFVAANPKGLVYQELSASSAPEVVIADATGHQSPLLFDADCNPIILRAQGNTITQHTRSGATWSQGSTGLDLAALVGGSPSSITLIASEMGADGKLHVFGVTQAGGVQRLVHGSRAAAANGDWTFEAAPELDVTELLAARVDPSGAIRVLYKSTKYPCDPCDLTLRHARWKSGGDWESSVVKLGVWGPPLDELVDSPTLAFDTEGRAIVAGQFQRRVITGSLQSTDLRLWREDGAAFCEEVVATESDGYEGSDGKAFTGASPVVGVDEKGRVHVVFLDQSVWHDSTGMNEVTGHIRHAMKTTGGWQLSSLFEQKGQTQSAQPLETFGALQMVMPAASSPLFVAGTQRVWDTASIYNSSAAPVTWKVTHLKAAVSP